MTVLSVRFPGASWTAYPILWLLSSQASATWAVHPCRERRWSKHVRFVWQGVCVVSDNILDEGYLVADVLSKAVFGLTMWHTKTKILKGHWEIARYVERKRNTVRYKLLGNTHKEPDYGEDDVEDRALRRRRRVHMGNAQQCFKLADACIRQAELCLSQASKPNNDLLKSAFVGDHYLRQVTPLYRRFEETKREWTVTARTHDQRREKYMFPIKRELKRHPMKPTLLECVDAISFPMFFHQEDSTLEAEDDVQKLDRVESVEGMPRDLQQSVARFGMRRFQRKDRPSLEATEPSDHGLDEEAFPRPGKYLGHVPSWRRKDRPSRVRDSSDRDEDFGLVDGSQDMIKLCRELESFDGDNPSAFGSDTILALRNSIQNRRSAMAGKLERPRRDQTGAATGSPRAENRSLSQSELVVVDGQAAGEGGGNEGHKERDLDLEVIIDIQREIERVHAMMGTDIEGGGDRDIHDIQEQISTVDALIAQMDGSSTRPGTR